MTGTTKTVVEVIETEGLLVLPARPNDPFVPVKRIRYVLADGAERCEFIRLQNLPNPK